MAGYLKVEELTPGKAYAVNARNFAVAIWTGYEFYGLRSKLGGKFMDTELHWDEDDHHGTVKPIKELT